MTESDPYALEPETNLKLPPSLDPHIASVTIRTDANNPNDFFDLRLSASFGSEHVKLEAGSDIIEVEISIRKAEIKFDVVNCNLHALADYHTDALVGRRTEVKSTERRGSVEVSADATLAPNSSFKATIGSQAKVGFQDTDQTEVQQDILSWRLQSADTVQVGYLPEFSRVLSGRIIDEKVSLRVSPIDPSKQVGVLARLRVRERWIDIKDVRTLKVTERVGGFIKGLSGDNNSASRRRELFERLLAHLVHLRLQDEGDNRDATIAASAVVFSPAKDRFSGVNVPASPPAITIDPTVIDQFISTAVGKELEFLNQIGVDVHDLTPKSELVDIWQKSPNRKISYPTVASPLIAKAFSASLGREVMVYSEEVDGNSLFRTTEYIVTNELSPPLDAVDIIQLFGSATRTYSKWAVDETLVYKGILTKGEEAYTIARLLGFNFGYQTFIQRIRPYSYKSGYGYLVSLNRLFDICGQPEAADDFVGLVYALDDLEVNLD